MSKLTEVETKIINQLQNRRSERVAKIACIDCGEDFEITVGRICTTYHSGLIVPCRCPKCKQKKDEKFRAYEEESVGDDK